MLWDKESNSNAQKQKRKDQSRRQVVLRPLLAPHGIVLKGIHDRQWHTAEFRHAQSEGRIVPKAIGQKDTLTGRKNDGHVMDQHLGRFFHDADPHDDGPDLKSNLRGPQNVQRGVALDFFFHHIVVVGKGLW